MSNTTRIKELFRKYGYTAVGVHLGVYAATISGCYVAAERNSGLEKLLVKYGLLSGLCTVLVCCKILLLQLLVPAHVKLEAEGSCACAR